MPSNVALVIFERIALATRPSGNVNSNFLVANSRKAAVDIPMKYPCQLVVDSKGNDPPIVRIVCVLTYPVSLTLAVIAFPDMTTATSPLYSLLGCFTWSVLLASSSLAPSHLQQHASAQVSRSDCANALKHWLQVAFP